MRTFKIFSLRPWLVWLSGLSASLRTKGSPVGFPVRAHAWLAGQVPSRGSTRGNHTLMFLSLSFSLPSPLSKNKKIKLKKRFFLLATSNTQYSVMNYGHHAVHYTPTACSQLEVCTLWLPSPVLRPSPTPGSHLWKLPICSLYLWVCFILFIFFRFYIWDHTVLVFLCLTYFT